MSHWPIMPILLPLLTGTVLLFVPRQALRAQRALSMAAAVALFAVAVVLVVHSFEEPLRVYAVGAWTPPFGITLVLDRLAALMILLTSVVAAFSLLYAVTGEDAQGRYFHPLFQFQLLGLNGAFLTGDLFNLFVFFEILLMASYALLMHGHGVERSRAAIHVVVLNLIGSGVFLLGIGAIYSVTGTLNFIDLARAVSGLDPEALGLARTGTLLLLVVFALKAALLPLTFWLPQSYGAATASVAALFSVMTKVGVYAIIRIQPLLFTSVDEGTVISAPRLLLICALASFVFGIFGLLAASTLRNLVSWLLIVSVGTLMIAVALSTTAGSAAALYYMVHSTLATAALFLIADVIRRQRASSEDRLDASARVRQPALLSTLFSMAAVSAAGLPPLSGFIGKVLVLQAASTADISMVIWGVILGGSAFVVLGLARAGSSLFWKTGTVASSAAATPLSRILAAGGLVTTGVMWAIFGSFAIGYVNATATQLADVRTYVRVVPGSTENTSSEQGATR